MTIQVEKWPLPTLFFFTPLKNICEIFFFPHQKYTRHFYSPIVKMDENFFQKKAPKNGFVWEEMRVPPPGRSHAGLIDVVWWNKMFLFTLLMVLE